MPVPRVLILRAPGTNCDRETAHAFRLAGGSPETWHINQVLAQPGELRQFQILCIPGGFSYGDDLAAGRILANQVRHHLRDALQQFQSDGKLVLGICNGFQVLIRAGILVGDDALGEPATLAWNESGRFQDRWVHLEAGDSPCVFLQGIRRIYLPIAHAEGRFVTRDEQVLIALRSQRQLALHYSPAPSAEAHSGPDALAPGSVSPAASGVWPFPINPNGSTENVAGLCDATGRVFGLMPHPERYVDRTQHPRWTRGEGQDPGEGLVVFQNAVCYFR
jgi:phosphoribosylformylglycinamidine (FGAM) synthase-like amidotransferase family enzyme